MHASQKHAVFSLIVIVVTGLTFAIIAPKEGVEKASGVFGLMGLLGFATLFYRKRSSQAVVLDERDGVILQRANLIAFSVFWVLFTFSCVIPSFVYDASAALPVRKLPAVLFVSWAIYQGVQSIAILVQYHRDAVPAGEGV